MKICVKSIAICSAAVAACHQAPNGSEAKENLRPGSGCAFGFLQHVIGVRLRLRSGLDVAATQPPSAVATQETSSGSSPPKAMTSMEYLQLIESAAARAPSSTPNKHVQLPVESGPKDLKCSYVIIGGGLAGLMAAAEILFVNHEGRDPHPGGNVCVVDKNSEKYLDRRFIFWLKLDRVRRLGAVFGETFMNDLFKVEKSPLGEDGAAMGGPDPVNRGWIPMSELMSRMLRELFSKERFRLVFVPAYGHMPKAGAEKEKEEAKWKKGQKVLRESIFHAGQGQKYVLAAAGQFSKYDSPVRREMLDAEAVGSQVANYMKEAFNPENLVCDDAKACKYDDPICGPQFKGPGAKGDRAARPENPCLTWAITRTGSVKIQLRHIPPSLGWKAPLDIYSGTGTELIKHQVPVKPAMGAEQTLHFRLNHSVLFTNEEHAKYAGSLPDKSDARHDELFETHLGGRHPATDLRTAFKGFDNIASKSFENIVWLPHTGAYAMSFSRMLHKPYFSAPEAEADAPEAGTDETPARVVAIGDIVKSVHFFTGMGANSALSSAKSAISFLMTGEDAARDEFIRELNGQGVQCGSLSSPSVKWEVDGRTPAQLTCAETRWLRDGAGPGVGPDDFFRFRFLPTHSPEVPAYPFPVFCPGSRGSERKCFDNERDDIRES